MYQTWRWSRALQACFPSGVPCRRFLGANFETPARTIVETYDPLQLAGVERYSENAATYQYLRQRMLCNALDDADIANSAVTEELQRGLITIRIVSRDRLLHAIEFDDNDALHDP